jgi:predicted nucleic acid-binding protein
MALIDTNILLRWLLNDHKELSPKAESLILRARAGSLLVTEVIVAEIVYILRSTGRDRSQTGEALLLIGRTPALKYENEELMMEIIGLLTSTAIDFADCYLLARTRREKVALETFDGPLNKLYMAN